MQLERLIRELPWAEVEGPLSGEVKAIVYDSRKVMPGYLFVALKGHSQDGHRFLDEAIRKGAVGAVVQNKVQSGFSAPVIRVPDTRKALYQLAAAFYGWPQKELKLIGITGTNGKTTTSYLLESILRQAGYHPGVIGTVNYRIGKLTCPAPVTTPESLDLMRALRKMADQGATHVVMEVSSHALDQGRVGDCPFQVGVFTNLSRDHLDYHGSMDAYFHAKSLLFQHLGARCETAKAWAVINADTPYGQRLMKMTDALVLTYGLGEGCHVRARNVSVTSEELGAEIATPSGWVKVSCPLLGRFNLYNMLAAVGAALCEEVSLEEIAEGLSQVSCVPGRVEPIKNNLGISVVVDYAHTPDALEKVLRDLRPLVNGRVITVFGCGGDRDKGKRPEMGRIAAMQSDLLIITSDNPRTEDPQEIVDQICKGVEGVSGGAPYIVELDRGKAIKKALGEARKGDLVLIAGKGHEDYQIIGTEKRPFDDRKVTAELLSRMR